MKNPESILFITEISFYPVFGGERIRSYGILKILSQSFKKVYAITGLNGENEEVRKMFPNIDFHYFDFKSLSQNSKLFPSNTCDEILTGLADRLIEAHDIRLAFIDYKYYGQYISPFTKKGLKVIYGTHNVQSRILKQKPANNIKEFVSLKLAYVMYSLHERRYLPRADRIIAVSSDDARRYQKYIPESKIVTLPNFIDEDMYLNPEIRKEDYIVMTANFFAYQNEVGIRWFLKYIWTEELSERTRLVLAGMGSKELFEQLNRNSTLTNVEVLGKLDDLKEVIRKAKVAIVPLLDGSGTRLKCIEAMALKTQVVSTSRGAEGIEHEGSILIADKPERFRIMILEVLDHKLDTTGRAFEVFRDKYSLSAGMKIFQSMVSEL